MQQLVKVQCVYNWPWCQIYKCIKGLQKWKTGRGFNVNIPWVEFLICPPNSSSLIHGLQHRSIQIWHLFVIASYRHSAPFVGIQVHWRLMCRTIKYLQPFKVSDVFLSISILSICFTSSCELRPLSCKVSCYLLQKLCTDRITLMALLFVGSTIVDFLCKSCFSCNT